MANSKFIITFTDVPDVNEEIFITENSLGLDLKEIFKTVRMGFGTTKIPQEYDAALEGDPPFYIYSGFISENYKTAFNLDFNMGGLFTVTHTNGTAGSGIGTVTVEANYPNAVFENLSEFILFATIEIINEVVESPIVIENITFSQSDTLSCNRVKVNVETDLLAVKILSPISVNPNTDNPFSFDWLRGKTITIQVEDENGNTASQIVTLPTILNASNFSIQVNNSPNGASVVVSNENSDGLELEYSLDNSTWQDSNVFSNLPVDNYTLYVRDQYGCSFTKTFTVNDVGIYTPYFYISKANSFRFAYRVTWGDSENYKNDENTLSCEAYVEEPWMEVQQFQSADVITTQFKSNYSSNVVKIIKSDNTEVAVPVVKKSNNIGIKDKRDGRKYNLGNGKTGVYFLAGNIYDFITNAVTGTHALNGLRPEWGVAGNYIQIASNWYLIEEIIYDEDKNAEVIVFTETYTGSEVDIVAGSIFNRFDYEVYEFTIDMVDYIDEYFRVKIEATDDNFEAITHLSEKIWCKVKHEDVLEIKYKNTTNTDIVYSTGIEHKIRVPFTIVKGKDDDDSEVHKTDTDSVLLNADIYESEEFLFEPVTKEIWRKMKIALSHELVFINGVGYVKNGAFNTEGPLGKSNLYVLTATMIKTGNVYNSQTTGLIDFDGSAMEIPGLISTESGFVKY